MIDISDKRNFIVYSVNPLNVLIKAFKSSQDIILINVSDEWHRYFPWDAPVSWSIDCKSLIFGNYAIHHWELEKNKSLQIFDGLRDEPEQIIVSRDGNLAIAPSFKGKALLMNLQTGEEILLEDIYSACCSQKSDRSFMVAGINSIRHLSLFI